MHHRTVRRKMTLEHMLSHLLLFKIIGGALAIDELYVSTVISFQFLNIT